MCGADGKAVLLPQQNTTFPGSIHWDPTGNTAYFVADRRLDQSMSPGIEQELMRLDARTGRVDRLLTLETDPKGYIDPAHWCRWEISISPDGHTVEAHCREGSNKPSFFILDLQRFSTRSYDVDLTLDGWIWRYTASDWSSDSQNIVVMAKAPLPPGDLSGLISEYDAFYVLNIHTGIAVVVSGWHKGINEWAVSPAPINP